MSIGVVGAGAFGTALAISLSAKHGDVILWTRDVSHATEMMVHGENTRRLPDVRLPMGLKITSKMDALNDCETILLAVPTQTLRSVLSAHHGLLDGKDLIACCKGVEVETGLGPTGIMADCVPGSISAVLTGPSFAHDIARGLPTALTLACSQPEAGARLQDVLTTRNLRLYRTTDFKGAELGGALKNVMAIACGTAMGAGFGESARAALMTRGFAEMVRVATVLGGKAETLTGLSGFGDLTLTCTSDGSRNYRRGLALGRGEDFDGAITVEGAATAQAVVQLAEKSGLDVPISHAVVALLEKTMQVDDALQLLLARPLKEE